MKWEVFKKKYTQVGLSPDDRLWEYDMDGSQIYQLKCGFGLKTLWDGGRAYWEKEYAQKWKDANELYFAVKGQLIPDSWSQKDVDRMVDNYITRLWGNCERLPRTSERFESVWKEHK